MSRLRVARRIFFRRTRHVQQPPFPELCDRVRLGVPWALCPLASFSSVAGVISSREVGCVSGETLVEDEGDWLPLVEEVWLLNAIR